jgi:ecotin
MKNLLILLLILIHSILYCQNKPSYPEPQKGYKKVDLFLPKIENPENYKVEVRFSFESMVIECANASFSFPIKNLKTEFGIPNFERFPYYVMTSDAAEILEGMNSNCNSKKKISKKILSSQNIFIEYQAYYARPFYIPDSWFIEYRIWKASDNYISINK